MSPEEAKSPVVVDPEEEESPFGMAPEEAEPFSGMSTERMRALLLAALLGCAGLLLVFPVEPGITAELIFDDEVMRRIEAESADNQHSQLVLMITHDDGERLTNNLSRVQSLMRLEEEAWDGSNPETAWEAEDIGFARIETPFSAWEDAFASRNRSLTLATQWADVLSPALSEGWCGENATAAEQQAFQATLLLLPDDANFNVACPEFSGAKAVQAPEANEVLWMVWLESDVEDADWRQLEVWADKVSESTEFEVRAVGVNMLFSESRDLAAEDLRAILIPSLVLLTLVLTLGVRDPRVAAATLGGAGLVITAELGLLSALGFSFSILDGIAFPIILGVAVDGAFWYCRSSRERDEVRRMLWLAMLTTIAAVSLALFSPVKAQRTLSLVIVVGIFLDWVVTRYILEEFYLRRRALRESVPRSAPDDKSDSRSSRDADFLTDKASLAWGWPTLLFLLACVALVSPSGVEVLDVDQFLPEDHPEVVQMEEMQSRYMLASSAVTWVVVDAQGDSPEDFAAVRDLQTQLGQHPSVISYDTGMVRAPMVLGVPHEEAGTLSPTIDSVSEDESGSILVRDARLRVDGVTTGVAIGVLIDSRNADAALALAQDIEGLLAQNGLTGEVGGDIVVGATLAKAFDESRVGQMLAAGAAVFIVAFCVLRSTGRAARVAVGAVAIGIAVDGLASQLGGRGVHTAPAVLLGMGFAADYLSHASSEHPPTKADTSARWWAAATSVSVFLLLGAASFPPAKHTGQLLAISIFLSVLLATALSFTHAKRPEANPN